MKLLVVLVFLIVVEVAVWACDQNNDCCEEEDPCNKKCCKPFQQNACTQTQGKNIKFCSLTGTYFLKYFTKNLSSPDYYCPTADIVIRTDCTGTLVANIISNTTDLRKKIPSPVFVFDLQDMTSCGHLTAIVRSSVFPISTPNTILNVVVVDANPSGIALIACSSFTGSPVTGGFILQSSVYSNPYQLAQLVESYNSYYGSPLFPLPLNCLNQS